jgi:hypothetical protein
MRIRNHRDLWAGVMFFVFGAGFALGSLNYQVGTAARMGPGYFPLMLGIILAALGLIIFVSAFSPSNDEAQISKVGWWEIGLILGAVALFALTLPYLGVIVAITALIIVSAVASHEFNKRDTLISIVVLLVLSYLVFVLGLELQFPLWPTFLSN